MVIACEPGLSPKPWPSAEELLDWTASDHRIGLLFLLVGLPTAPVHFCGVILQEAFF